MTCTRAACGRCSPARRSGANCSPSRAPAPTSPASPPGRSATATSGSSTDRRCGRTLAQSPKWGLLLARTEPRCAQAPGLSYFVLDMHAARRRRPAAAPDHRRGGVQRGLHHRRPHPRPRAARRRGQRLAVAATTLMNERVALGGGRRRPADRSDPTLINLWSGTRAGAGYEPVDRDRARRALDPSGGAAVHRSAGARRPRPPANRARRVRSGSSMAAELNQADLQPGGRPDGCGRDALRDRLREDAARRTAHVGRRRASSSCAPGPTRSRAARPRSCATSSASASSACPASHASIVMFHGTRSHADRRRAVAGAPHARGLGINFRRRATKYGQLTYR